MAVDPLTSQAVSMIEVLISYCRPESLDEPELRAWLADQVQTLSAEAVTFLPPEPTMDRDRDGLVRFALDADTARSAEGRIAELVTDMRMLGLGPNTVAMYHAPQQVLDAGEGHSSP
jgi:hypothetical protein